MSMDVTSYDEAAVKSLEQTAEQRRLASNSKQLDGDMIDAAQRIAKKGAKPIHVHISNKGFDEKDYVSFKKFDVGKPKMSLLPPVAIRQLAEVLTFGAKKYADFNWTKGCDWSRYSNAALRHLFAWIGGDDLDEESGLPHLAHAMCCLAFLLESAEKGYGVDDRHKED